MNDFSDYGSGSSMNLSTSWGSQDLENWGLQYHKAVERPRQKVSSLLDLIMGRCTLDDVMQEFKLNGSDAPYNPEDDKHWEPLTGNLSGGSSNVYLRQKSWPAPDSTPEARLPRPERAPRPVSWVGSASEPWIPTQVEVPESSMLQSDGLSEEQRRVVSSLSDDALLGLLQHLQTTRGISDRRNKNLVETKQECRFCKNNGERESYYRSHSLKDARGLVQCPVLRAFRCRRCGAAGPFAHTAKYCPVAPAHERLKSMAMMRSLRMASGKRRAAPSSDDQYVMFGQASREVLQDTEAIVNDDMQLHPLWAALEKKLLL